MTGIIEGFFFGRGGGGVVFVDFVIYCGRKNLQEFGLLSLIQSHLITGLSG